MLKLRHFG